MRSVHQWSPGEGSKKEMIKARLVKAVGKFFIFQRSISFEFFSQILLYPNQKCRLKPLQPLLRTYQLSIALGAMNALVFKAGVWSTFRTQTNWAQYTLPVSSLTAALSSPPAGKYHITPPTARCIPVSIVFPCQEIPPP